MVTDAWGFDRVAEIWFGWMLQMGWQVALLAALVWGLTQLLRRSNAALRHSLWLLVFVKLLLPPVLGTPWSLGTVARDAWPAVMKWVVDDPAAPSSPVGATRHLSAAPESSVVMVESHLAQGADGAQGVAPRPFENGQGLQRETHTKTNWGMARILMLVWGLGALGMLGVIGVQWGRHRQRLLRNTEAAPEEVLAWGRAQAGRLGLRQPVDIRVTPQLRVPCVVGFYKAVVLLPREVIQRLSPSQQADLIAHEMAHIKRRDLQTGWLASVLVCLYWFHPAVWLANLYLRREREMACDDRVLYATRREGTEYASTMMRIAEGFDSRVPLGAGFLGLFEIADNLLQRIRSVSDGTRSRRAGWRSVATVALVALVLIPMGAWTTSWAQTTDTASAMEREIEHYYAQADPEVKGFMGQTARNERLQGLWLPAEVFKELSATAREAKVQGAIQALQSEPNDAYYAALAEAGALDDARLVPALTKTALDMKEGGQDNRARWMAVAALGRLGDKKAVPVLIPLIDHYNLNTRMWARASLVRLTGKNFGTDKQAWAAWANAQGPDTALSPAALEEGSRQSEEKMKVAQTTSGMPSENASVDAYIAAAEKEIGQYYSSAAPEVKEYIKWTARQFGRAQMWQPEGAPDALTPEQREEKVKYLVGVLNGEYGRHLCNSLAEAGVIKDKRLLPGLMKAAGYQREGGDYDCRPKWIAVASLGRQDDPSAAPLLVDLVDHGNQNTKMWAQASMSRLTGQNFGTDKQAWAEWWNANGKAPKIDVSQLKPWTPPAQETPSARVEPGDTKQTPAVGPGELGVVGFLGVEVKDATAWREKAGLTTPGGAYVNNLVPNGPADKAGVQKGDIVCTLNGKAVTDSNEFVTSIRAMGQRTEVELGVWRGRQMMTVKVVIAAAYPVPVKESRSAVRPPGKVSTGQ